MGHFYANLTVTTPNTAAIAKALTALKRIAFISPPHNKRSVIYDQTCDELNFYRIQTFGGLLSQELGCAVLPIAIQGDDVLNYWLYESGKRLDKYCSSPHCFDTEPRPKIDRGGDAGILCKALKVPAAAPKVQNILNRKYVFEFERHEALAVLLDLPPFSVACGYSTIAAGYLPKGLTQSNLTAVG